MSKRPLVQRLREEPNFAFWLEIAEAADRIEELEAEVKRLRAVVDALRALIAESTGVCGLHRNGDFASWDWLMKNKWLESLAALEGA